MNIELKPIAESKIRQLGGDVCGVLVRTQDSEVMDRSSKSWIRSASFRRVYQ